MLEHKNKIENFNIDTVKQFNVYSKIKDFEDEKIKLI